MPRPPRPATNIGPCPEGEELAKLKIRKIEATDPEKDRAVELVIKEMWQRIENKIAKSQLRCAGECVDRPDHLCVMSLRFYPADYETAIESEPIWVRLKPTVRKKWWRSVLHRVDVVVSCTCIPRNLA